MRAHVPVYREWFSVVNHLYNPSWFHYDAFVGLMHSLVKIVVAIVHSNMFSFELRVSEMRSVLRFMVFDNDYLCA
jgi:hypothetical protein